MKKSDLPYPYYLSVPEAAKLCGVSRNTLYTWVRKGKVPAYQTPGRTNLIRPSDMVYFMENSGLFVPSALRELAQRDEMSGKLAETGEPGKESISVLVVDDDDQSRAFLARILNESYRIFQARTGYEALHMLTIHEDIRLVLLDLRMPGQHGLETLKEIENIRPSVLVVIITGFAGEIPVDENAHPQVARVLIKPVRIETLKQVMSEVESLLSGRGNDQPATG